MDGRGGCKDLVLCERGSIEGLSAVAIDTFVLFERAKVDFVGERRL